MKKNTFKIIGQNIIKGLLYICIIATVIAIFFSEQIATHRIQAISAFIGVGLLLWGINIYIKQSLVYPVKLFGKKNTLRESGKNAKAIGAAISIAGIMLGTWGLVFWIRFIIPSWWIPTIWGFVSCLGAGGEIVGQTAAAIVTYKAASCVVGRALGPSKTGLTTSKKYFTSKTAKQANRALRKKYGPPHKTPGGKSFYNPKTKKSYQLHHEHGHCGSLPHVDIRTRGSIPDRGPYFLQE